MLSDFSYSTLPFDIPILPQLNTEQDPLVPLNFDDLLDIAREFEFTRTITHIWPCEEEEPSTCHETELDDILAAIVPNGDESPIPLPVSSFAPPMTIDPIHAQQVDVIKSSVHPALDANGSVPKGPVSLTKETQVRPGTTTPITTLRGWSPPNGSQFLDLDDSFIFPQPDTDMWNSPWLAMFLATQPLGGTNQSSTAVPAIGDSQPQTTAMVPKPPSVITTDKMSDDPKKKSVLTPVQPSTRAILEPAPVRSAVHTNSNVASQSVTTPHAKQSKSRSHPTPATSGVSTANYGRAPRGGIPPHIARSVTQANILRVEKERKVMQDSFSSATMGAPKKPSVLRKVAHVEKETNKRVSGTGSGKKLFGWDENDEKEARATKRARV
ncbi:hypothetical protein V8E55_002634 [Tylopilus felleus]